MDFCPLCGLSSEFFLSTGKFGCRSCPYIFLPKQIRRAKFLPIAKFELEKLTNVKEFPHPNWTGIRYRLRIARCLRKGFFPYYARYEDEILNLLEKAKLIQLHQVKKKDSNTSQGLHFYFGDEDHLRFEIVGEKSEFQSMFSDTYHDCKKFLYQTNLWAYETPIGFINSCPTNCGRGDRMSVQAKIESKYVPELVNYLEPLMGFGIEFSPQVDVHSREKLETNRVLVQISCKNAFPSQKLRFFKILGLLGLR